MAKELWPDNFGPSFPPELLFKYGIMEGRYLQSILADKRNHAPSVCRQWLHFDNVISDKDTPRDPKLNRYGVYSRSSLKVWKENGWTTVNSPLGWIQWYVLFYYGRRGIKLKDGSSEDLWQINRWRSFVARHMGQWKAAGQSEPTDKQKQALFQWAWKWTKTFNDSNVSYYVGHKTRESNSERASVYDFLMHYGFKKEAEKYAPPKNKQK